MISKEPAQPHSRCPVPGYDVLDTVFRKTVESLGRVAIDRFTAGVLFKAIFEADEKCDKLLAKLVETFRHICQVANGNGERPKESQQVVGPRVS